MSYSRKPHWTVMLAVGLPLLVAGCAGTTSRYGAPGDPAAEQAAEANLSALSLADKLRAEKNYSSAAAMYHQAHQANPDDVRPLLGMGESFLAIGANVDAANAYGAALSIQSNNAEALFGLGKARILLNQPELAVPILHAATRAVPNDPRPMTALGVAQDKIGDHAAAQQSYKAVLALDPNNRAALNNLALSLALSGDQAGSIKILEGLNQSATATSVVRQNLALVYGVNGQMEQSERLGRVDLAEPSVQQNLATMSTTTSEADRHALLKSALGVELTGLQYTAAQRSTSIPAAPAQLPIDDSTSYVPPPSNGEMPVITVETTRLKPSTTLASSTAAKSVATEDEWGDDWDEELVDATELASPTVNPTTQPAAEAPQIADATPASVDAPLPAAPTPVASTQTTAVVAPSAPKIAPATSDKSVTTPAQIAEASVQAPAVAPADIQSSDSSPAKIVTVNPPKPTAASQIADLKAKPETTMESTASTAPTAAADSSSQPAAQADAPQVQATVATATDIGGAKVYTVQLAAYRSEAEASAGWAALTTDQSDLLNGLPHHVEKADLGADKGIFFRLKAGSFSDIAKAKALCSDLQTRAVDCMVVETAGSATTTPKQSS